MVKLFTPSVNQIKLLLMEQIESAQAGGYNIKVESKLASFQTLNRHR
jgi:hypothetical protein